MQLIFDEQTLRQLIRPIVAEIIAGLVKATRLGKLVSYQREELERIAREGMPLRQ
jgi:hypothetical protein